MARRFWFPWFILYLWATAVCWAQTTVTGQIFEVSDGDTVNLLAADKSQVKIRLQGIDVPQKGQEFGKKAREALAKRIQGKEGEASRNYYDM